MFIVVHVLGVVLVVTVGYFVMWTASQTNTPKGVAVFGKIVSIALLIIAGLVLIYGPRMHQRMMGSMSCPYMSMGSMHGMKDMEEMKEGEGDEGIVKMYKDMKMKKKAESTEKGTDMKGMPKSK